MGRKKNNPHIGIPRCIFGFQSYSIMNVLPQFLTGPIFPCPVLTVACWPAYRSCRRQVRWSGIPISWRIFQFVVIHTVKGFSIVNEAELDFFFFCLFVCFYNSLVFSMIHQMLAIWSLVPLPFLNPACTSESSWFTCCWSLTYRILSITLLACEMSTIVR